VATYRFVQYKSILSLSLLVAAVLPVSGQEVAWCRDYRTAWEASRASGRPLLIDFGTEACIWCKKLDATTLRDPAVVEMLNAGFVAVQVNAHHEPGLARALRVHSFPTIVLAGPDGTVLDQVVGYTDAARFQQHLRRVLAWVPVPDQAEKDYREATAAIASPDYPRAIGLLKKVLADGGSRPVQLRARMLLQEFEQQAADRLRWGRELQQKGQLAESSAVLGELARTFEGTAAASAAGQMLLAARAR